uniref:Uncharacterized protein n=1 Tax=Anguilla anguilla TaxID=7936 RepID=A0A0E9UWZ2_ANGAN
MASLPSGKSSHLFPENSIPFILYAHLIGRQTHHLLFVSFLLQC